MAGVVPFRASGPTVARATPGGGTASLVARSRLHRSMIRLSGAGVLRRPARGVGRRARAGAAGVRPGDPHADRTARPRRAERGLRRAADAVARPGRAAGAADG